MMDALQEIDAAIQSRVCTLLIRQAMELQHAELRDHIITLLHHHQKDMQTNKSKDYLQAV